MAPKVAYAVYKGRVPGVYDSFEKANEQVKHFSGFHFKGFTAAKGGRQEARKQYDLFVEKERAQLHTLPNSQNLKKKERPPSWQAEKNGCGKIRRTGCSAGMSRGGSTATCQSRLIKEPLTSSRQNFPHEDSNSASNGVLSSSIEYSSNEDGGESTTRVPEGKNDLLQRPNQKTNGNFQIHADRSAQNKVNAPGHHPVRGTAPSDTASNASSDYGEFPDDLAQLTSTQISSIKQEPGSCNGNGCKPTELPNSSNRQLSEDGPELCAEQRNLVQLILSGVNVFYTGSAGSGKSTVLRTFVRELTSRNKRVRILASTGRAALQAGGATIHSYAGWTPDSRAKSITRLKRDAHKKRNWKRFKNTDILVIDEINMVENHLFERLNRVMKDSREDNRPFGGVQVIVTGDFYQLPPVKPFQYCMECGKKLISSTPNKSHCSEPTCKDEGLDIRTAEHWAFCSEAWAECKFNCVKLEEIHRQNDVRFIEILQKFRVGKDPSQGDINYIRSKGTNDDLAANKTSTEEKVRRGTNKSESSSEQPFTIKLFCRRDDVASENEEQLALLDHECLEFLCLDNFEWNPDHEGLKCKFEKGTNDNTLRALDEHQLEAVLELKKGMPVVLLANLDFDAGLINGSQGIITGFRDHDLCTIPDLSGAHAKYKHCLIKRFIAKAEYPKWPIVKFPDAGGREVTIYPHCMVSELGDGGDSDTDYSLLSRTQIPLIAGWAITIHRSQGMTLSHVEVDLAGWFEQSQRYVALSRARDVKGLTVTDFGKRIKGADDQVSAFMDGTEWLDLSGRSEEGRVENG